MTKSNGLKKLGSHKVVPFVLVFLAGTLLGGLGVSQWHNYQTDPSSPANTITSKRSAERLEKNYQEAKESIEKAVQQGKLSAEHANEVTKRLEAAYNFLKKNPSTSPEARAALREMRDEWRQWANENNVSSRYLIRIY